LFGAPDLIKFEEIKKCIEDYAGQQEGKTAKFIMKDKVSFKFKEKGKAAINATNVL
jgi:hypothetical protein